MIRAHARPDHLENREEGLVKNGKGQAKKPAVDKPKSAKAKPAKPAKVAHRTKAR